MGWTAPITAVANTLFTSSDWNVYVRDNLNETEAAKITAANQYIVSTGSNSLAARGPAYSQVSAAESTTSTTWVSLPTANAVTVTTGTAALVYIGALCQCTVANTFHGVTFDISGATVSPPNETYYAFGNMPAGQFPRSGMWIHRTGLTPGSSTFTMKFVSGGTATATFSYRVLIVLPL